MLGCLQLMLMSVGYLGGIPDPSEDLSEPRQVLPYLQDPWCRLLGMVRAKIASVRSTPVVISTFSIAKATSAIDTPILSQERGPEIY